MYHQIMSIEDRAKHCFKRMHFRNIKNQMRFHKKIGQVVFYLLDIVSYYPIRKGRFPLISTGIKNDMRPHQLGITKVLPSSGYFTHKLPTQIE